ncbi:MAG: response regulator transcription factor [Myxococcales bacterium]|nr:response regulator transcription factor [Myxococcales bacterium]
MTNERIRILIVDDHDLARAGLKGLLEDEADMVVVGEARSGIDAVSAYRACQPTVVLMDIRMPTFDGIQATAALLREDAKAKVLVISSYDTEEEVFRVHEAGAKGYLLKESRRAEILEAVRSVATGGRHTPPSVAERLESRKRGPTLSSRERQILQLLHKGRNNREIAESLALSPGTVRMYVSQILEKIGASNRTEAVTLGLARGLISPGD